jgi:hypothetical protein
MRFILGVGPFAFIAAAFALDWIKLSTLKNFAIESGFGPISVNPFKSSAAVQQLRKSLPEGALRSRIRLLEFASAACWLAFAALIFIPQLWKK